MSRFSSSMKTIATVLTAVLFIGCAHENSEFKRADFNSRKPLKSHHSNSGELTDADVIGADAKAPTEEAIRNALDRASSLGVKRGESVLVLQSGESVPDSRMVSELNKYYRAIPFSGVRSDWAKGDKNSPPDFYAKSLRMAAAQAGAEKILCFWGSLEVARHDLSTKTVTWLPVIDVIVPDEKNKVRVHLKMALVDVRSGAWSILRTEPQEDMVVSTGWGREHVENSEIRALKEKTFVVAVNSLTTTK